MNWKLYDNAYLKTLSVSSENNFTLNELSFTEQVIYWAIILTPIWWLLGIQPILYPLLLVFLLGINFDIYKLIRIKFPVCIYAWLAMGITMLFLSIKGLNDVDFNPVKVLATVVTFIKSYFLIFSGLALPFFSKIRVKTITKAVAWMTTGYIITLSLQIGMLLAGIGNEYYYPLLARLVPGDKLSLLVKTAVFQPFFGINLPRTSLYTPDPPILGVCGILCFFICLGESNRRLQIFALTGSFLALIISQSRLAWVSFPIAIIILLCFHSRFLRQSSLWLASFTAIISIIFELTLKDLVSKPQEIFTNARPESSTDRALVVGKTLEAWLERPWFGWGIAQDSVTWHIYDIVLGSFSTYAAVLYLYGVFGFVVFITALILTICDFWQPAFLGNLMCQRALASLIALYLLAEGLPLSWMCVYFWFFFIWLGAIMKEVKEQTPVISSWQELSSWEKSQS